MIKAPMSRFHNPRDDENRNIQVFPVSVVGEDLGQLESIQLCTRYGGFRESIFDNPDPFIRYISQYKLLVLPIPTSIVGREQEFKIIISKVNTFIESRGMTQLYLATSVFDSETVAYLEKNLTRNVTLVETYVIEPTVAIPRNSIIYNL